MGKRALLGSFLGACREAGVEFVALEDLAREILERRRSIPVCDQVLAPIDGRSGLVASQAA